MDVNPLAAAAPAAAGRLLGTSLGEPVDLGGSHRSLVLRARRADGGGSVIVKSYTPEEPDALRSFAAEAAGLAFRPGAPELLGTDPAVPGTGTMRRGSPNGCRRCLRCSPSTDCRTRAGSATTSER